LIDTPLAPYFAECVSFDDLTERNIEIIRNVLYKAYLEDFYQFCKKIGGSKLVEICMWILVYIYFGHCLFSYGENDV